MRKCWQPFLLMALLLQAGCRQEPVEIWQGYVEGEYIYVSSPVSGRLETLSVVKGQQVEAGKHLFELEPEPELSAHREAESQVVLQQSNLDNLLKGKRPSELASIRARLEKALSGQRLAEIESERVNRLIRTKAASREQLDRVRASLEQARYQVAEIRAELETAGLGAREDEIDAVRAALEQAQAQLKGARWRLEQKRLLSPESGQVFDTLYRAGEWVPSGRPVVSILPPANRKIRFFVPEPIISSFRPGQEVYIHFDGAETPVSAKVSYISPQAEYTPPVIYSSQSRAKLVFLLEARPSEQDAHTFKPGQPVDVSRDPLFSRSGRGSFFSRMFDRLAGGGQNN